MAGESGVQVSGERRQRVKGHRASEGVRIRVSPCLLRGSNAHKDIEDINIGSVVPRVTNWLLRLYGMCGWFVTAAIVFPYLVLSSHCSVANL